MGRTPETARIKWIDVDEKICTIKINNPTKGSNVRIVKVTAMTLAMLNNMPITGEYMFNTKADTIRTGFTNREPDWPEYFKTPNSSRSTCIRFAIGKPPWNITEPRA